MTASPGERTTNGWVPDAGTFASRLVLVRHHMGWHNVDRAARETGLPKESWRTWEKGLSVPRELIQVVSKISQVTGVDFGWLYGGEAMAGERPSDEAMRWLRLDPGKEGNSGGHFPNVDYAGSTERPTVWSRPRDNRPIGGPQASARRPGPGRPERLPRRGGR